MAKDRRSRDQKRREKLAKRQAKSRQTEPLAYLGSKYQTEELVPTWLRTEIGIYETFIMTDRKLLDQTVVTALERLITDLRAGALPPLTDDETIQYEEGQEEDLIIENIRRNWAHHFQTEWRPPKDKLIGILRTILGSIEKVRAPGPCSQSYMHHIAGFLTKKMGVSVTQVSDDLERLPEPKEDELIELGRRWIRDQTEASAARFHDLADHLLANGEAERVIDGCHRLIGEVSDPLSEATVELTALSFRARESLITVMG